MGGVSSDDIHTLACGYEVVLLVVDDGGEAQVRYGA